VATFFKVVVLGDGGIGKTSICNYLTTGEFFGSYKLSIGADFFSKKLVVDGEDITLQICDIGGQDQFAEISNIFTKGAHGAILCYDTTRRDTIDSLTRWMGKLEDIGIPKVLVSTKNDVEDLKEVLDEEGVQAAQKFNIPFYIPTTSLKGIGITETFEAISKLMLMYKKGLPLPQVSEMVDTSQPKQVEVYTISGSQHISAQPLGIGRVPTAFDSNDEVQPPVVLSAPETPIIQPVTEDLSPPIIEDEIEAKPSFIRPISLTPPVVKHDAEIPHTEQTSIPTPKDFEDIEPPTEPEKTAIQPISSITPPLSEQYKTQPTADPIKADECEDTRSNFSFLDRLNQERKRLNLDKEDEEEI